MSILRSVLCLAVLACPFFVVCAETPEGPTTGLLGTIPRVNNVRIFANDLSSFDVIKKLVPLQMGDVIDHAALREAEKKLAETGLFINDPEQGMCPSITVSEEGDTGQKTIVVVVHEMAVRKYFPQGLHHDFGAVLQGNFRVKLRVPIFNSTDTPITFTDIHCGCGSFIHDARMTKKALQPNEAGELRISWEPRRVFGSRSAALRIDAETAGGKKYFLFTATASTTLDFEKGIILDEWFAPDDEP